METESAGYIGKLPEGQDFNGEEQDICRRTADIVGDGSPSNAAGTVQEADEADHRSRCHGGHADDILGHGRSNGQEGDAAGNVRKEEPPNGVELPRFHGVANGKLRLCIGIFNVRFLFSSRCRIFFGRR